MRNFLLIVLGAVIMYVLLKVIAGKTVTADSTVRLKKLASTQQAANLVRTNEFREIVKTKEFIDFITSLTEEQLITVSKSLAG
jgi:hypothetical protein